MLLANLLCTLALAPSEPLKTISTTVWAPWASDPALEAAALIHEAHGAAKLAAYWRSWSELPVTTIPVTRTRVGRTDAGMLSTGDLAGLGRPPPS